jgi:uncharacterized protein (TIGR03435 family)
MPRFQVVLLLAGALSGWTGGVGASAPEAARIAFDTVSVRLQPAPAAVASLVPLGADDAYTPTGGRFKATNNLLHYIAFAYKLQPRQIKQMAHEAPKWVAASAFEIEARSSRPNVTKDEMRLMMQSLLADQFHLVVHREVRLITIFGLTAAKPGAADRAFKPHVDGRGCSKNSPGAASNACRGVIVNLEEPCGGCRKIRAEGLSMTQFAAFLTRQTKVGTVIDRTGLAGIFDFRFEWDATPDVAAMPQLLPSGTAPPDPTGGSGGGNYLSDYVPEQQPRLNKALKAQLGLTLVPESNEAEFYVIDHLQNPE